MYMSFISGRWSVSRGLNTRAVVIAAHVTLAAHALNASTHHPQHYKETRLSQAMVSNA